MVVLNQRACCVSTSFLSRITFSYNMLFMTKRTPLLKWNRTSARVAGSTALVYMQESVYECGETAVHSNFSPTNSVIELEPHVCQGGG